MKFINKNIIELDKKINELDKFVFRFVKILKEYSDYVIVGGFVPILLGRAKTTDEIDIFIKHLSKEKFNEFYNHLKKEYWYLNAKSSNHAYQLLRKDLFIRLALKNTTSPNFKIKIANTNLERANFVSRTKVITNLGTINLSPLDVAINFKKHHLKSYRDIEDALYLEEILKIKKLNSKINTKNKWLIPSNDRLKDRMNFVEYWADYVRTHPDKVWSKQQNILINSIMQNAKNSKLTPKEYLTIKNEKCSR